MNYATVIMRRHAGHVEHYMSHTLETAQALALGLKAGETAYLFECGNPSVLEVHHGPDFEPSNGIVSVMHGRGTFTTRG